MKTLTEIYHQWFEEVWNQGSDEAVDRLLANPCRSRGLGPEITNPEQFRAFRKGIFDSMCDLKVEVLEAVENGDWVFGRFVVKAVHRASGKPIVFHGASNARFADGKFVEGNDVIDFLSVLIQVGALPEDVLPRALGGEHFLTICKNENE